VSEKTLSKPKAIFFDLDGTLADTAPDLVAAVSRLQLDRDISATPYSALRPFASAGARGLIGAAFGIAPGDEAYDGLRAEFLDNYEASIADKSTLFDGVAELLGELQKREIIWGIVTNKPGRLTDVLVPQIGLGHAACVISGDTMPHAKPHPAPLLEATRLLGIDPSQCWYVGDDLRDIEAGRAAGMTTFAASWGYCGHTAPHSWQADVVIAQPLDLLTVLNV
jgi:2-phosphoglycolate phosphatase